MNDWLAALTYMSLNTQLYKCMYMNICIYVYMRIYGNQAANM